jgi:hypothetical protein
MPPAVEDCKKKLVAKWGSDPASRPKPKQKDQDAESQAYAICTAMAKRATEASMETMFGEGGFGPTLVGAAATNKPFIPMLEESKVVERDGKKWVKVHLAIPGYFNHPTGQFVLNRQVFGNFIANMSANVVGQALPYDARHKPELGALGWIEELEIDDRGWLFGWVDPTDVGLSEIENRRFRYSSMTFHRNFKRDDVKLDLERAEELDLGVELEAPEQGENMEGNDDKVTALEQELEQLRGQAVELERVRAEMKELRLSAARARSEAVVQLAQSHRDKDGNAHPKQLLEFIQKLVTFGQFGEVEVSLSLDTAPDGLHDYLVAAARELVESMPGVVPCEQHTSAGRERSEVEDFDYASEWKGV